MLPATRRGAYNCRRKNGNSDPADTVTGAGFAWTGRTKGRRLAGRGLLLAGRPQGPSVRLGVYSGSSVAVLPLSESKLKQLDKRGIYVQDVSHSQCPEYMLFKISTSCPYPH